MGIKTALIAGCTMFLGVSLGHAKELTPFEALLKDYDNCVLTTSTGVAGELHIVAEQSFAACLTEEQAIRSYIPPKIADVLVVTRKLALKKIILQSKQVVTPTPPKLVEPSPTRQRAVLYDEDPTNERGKQYFGSVTWRTEPIKPFGNQKPDIAVRGDIEIPDRKFKMTMSFRRNTDTSLPASHTAELTFILPRDFPGGGVGNVPGILMKSNEQASGTPLAGLAVKVVDGFFLVGLSNVDADRTLNLRLLERSWFDVPLVYENQRRAIIAIEKGAPGDRAFADAFAAWGESAAASR